MHGLKRVTAAAPLIAVLWGLATPPALAFQTNCQQVSPDVACTAPTAVKAQKGRKHKPSPSSGTEPAPSCAACSSFHLGVQPQGDVIKFVLTFSKPLPFKMTSLYLQTLDNTGGSLYETLTIPLRINSGDGLQAGSLYSAGLRGRGLCGGTPPNGSRRVAVSLPYTLPNGTNVRTPMSTFNLPC